MIHLFTNVKKQPAQFIIFMHSRSGKQGIHMIILCRQPLVTTERVCFQDFCRAPEPTWLLLAAY
jgi:hypothetical protein